MSNPMGDRSGVSSRFLRPGANRDPAPKPRSSTLATLLLACSLSLSGTGSARAFGEGGFTGPTFESFIIGTAIGFALDGLFGSDDKPKPFFIEARPDPGVEGAPSSCAADADGGATPDPVLIKSGNKFKVEVDWAGDQAEMPLNITRTYNRSWTGQGVFGTNWPSVFDYKLAFYIDTQRFGDAIPVNTPVPSPNGAASGLTRIYVDRPDGSRFTFTYKPIRQRWEDTKPESVAWLVRKATNLWELHNEDQSVETYNDNGHVLSVKNQFGIGWTFAYLSSYRVDTVTHTSGRILKFTWGSSPRVDAIADPAGGVYGYSYTSQGGMLSTLTKPGVDRSGKALQTWTYHYEDGDRVSLTGISTDAGRYSTYSYYPNKRVKESGLSENVRKLSFTYGTGGTAATPTSFTEITNTRNAVTRYEFEQVRNEPRLRRVKRSGVTDCPDAMAETEYEPATGFIDYELDRAGPG